MAEKRCIFIFLLWICFSPCGTAQQNDAEVWTGASINQRITKNLSGSFEEQLRLNDNVSAVKNLFSEIGLAYIWNKYVKITGNYRFSNRTLQNGNIAFGHRFHGDIRLRYKAKPVIFYLRTRAQTESKTTRNGAVRDYYNRNKLQIKLDLDRRVRPYISSEVYFDINLGDFNKVRYTTGLDFDLKNRMEVTVFYRLQREFNMENPTYSYIFGVGYSYRIRGRLIKKKNDQE